jgi:hypothetical protein
MTPPHTTLAALRLTRAQHAALVAAVVLCRLLATRSCPIYDDAFITFRYARNLAEGAGLVYNPGAAWEPVLGTTTPFYALVLAGLAKLGATLTVASIALNVVLDAITAILLPRLLGFARASSTLALLTFAALPYIARISVGGMESPLFALCGVGAVLALSAESAVLAGFLAAIACVVRPEGVLLCAILFVSRLRKPRELVRFTLPVLAVGVVAIVVLSSIYGSPIPQSVLAKATMHDKKNEWPETFSRWQAVLSQSYAPTIALLPVVPLVLFGAWRAVRAGGALRAFSLWALGISASYFLARTHTWGWYFYVPLLGWSLWFGIGVECLLAWIAPRIPAGIARISNAFGPQALAAAAVAATAVVSTLKPTLVDKNVYAPMQAWAEETSRREPNARILASDIGAIGWHWKGTVLDSEGLVWPEALRYKLPNPIIEHEKPEYLMVVLEQPRLKHLMSRPDLFALYTPVARFSIRGATKLDPTVEEIEPLWSQDYLVLKRRAP